MFEERFIILFIALLITNIYFAVESIKTKDNKNRLISFSVNISALICVALAAVYALNNHYMSWSVLEYLAVCFFAGCAFLLLLIVNIIFKVIEVRNNKKQEASVQPLAKTVKAKAIIIPALLVISLTFLTSAADYAKYVRQYRGEIRSYNSLRKKEINLMADYANSKYGLDLQEGDCIYYREQDYSRHTDLFGNGHTYNIPFIALFEKDGEQITVVDRKGFISDNRQLEEINSLITDFFYKNTGVAFDFVEFQRSYVGSTKGNDNVINVVLQTKFNALITEDNIGEFLECVFLEPDLSVTFYYDDSEKENEKDESIKYDMASKLNYLGDYENIEIIQVYGFEGDFEISRYEVSFPEERRDYGNSASDYDDGYKFGCYYAKTPSQKYTFSLKMDLDRGYSAGKGEDINGWIYRELN